MALDRAKDLFLAIFKNTSKTNEILLFVLLLRPRFAYMFFKLEVWRARESFPLTVRTFGALLKCFCGAIGSVLMPPKRSSTVPCDFRDALEPLLRPLPEVLLSLS